MQSPPSVSLSVCFHYIFGTNWPMTLNFCLQVGDWRSRSWVRLMRLVWPQASHCKKIFLRTPKIFKFKDIFKDKFTSIYNYWKTHTYTHTTKQPKNVPRCTLLTVSTDQAHKQHGSTTNCTQIQCCKLDGIWLIDSFTQVTVFKEFMEEFWFLRTFKDSKIF